MIDNPTCELKKRILEASEKKDGFAAAMNYGQLIEKGELSDDDSHYYCGLALAANHQVNEAIEEFLSVKEDAELFETAIVDLGVQYSINGDIDGLFSVLITKWN